MLYNGQINGRNTQLSTTRTRLIKHHDTPSTTIAFAATVSSTSMMSSTSSHQDKLLVAGVGNGDVEVQQGPSHVVKERRHKYEYPTQKLEQSRGDSYVDNHDRDATLIIVTKNYPEKKNSCNNNGETSGSNANNQQESSRASSNGSISQGNTKTANDGQCCHCHVCGFTWSTWDKVLLFTFLFSTCAAAVAFLMFEVDFTHTNSWPPNI
jgi:hypothetical protein